LTALSDCPSWLTATWVADCAVPGRTNAVTVRSSEEPITARLVVILYEVEAKASA